MKKNKIKEKDPIIMEIKYNDYAIKINLNDIIEIGDYIPIMSHKKIDEENYEIYTGVLNKSFEVVVPIRKEIISKAKLLNDELSIDLMLFKNGCLIYQNKGSCYLVDLNSVSFENINGVILPKDYIIKFKTYHSIGNGKIIVYEQEKSYIYDVNNKKINGFIYDYVTRSNSFEDLYEAYFSKKEEGIIMLSVCCLINDEGIYNQVIVNNLLQVYPVSDMFDDREKLTQYCDDCYNSYLNRGESICKKIN